MSVDCNSSVSKGSALARSESYIGNAVCAGTGACGCGCDAHQGMELMEQHWMTLVIIKQLAILLIQNTERITEPPDQ